MQQTSPPLGDLSIKQFLSEYWQKKPLVIKQGFNNFTSPISAEELAGLACEEEVNSRIIIEKDGDHPWQAIYGPMNDETFASLPETHWTLLVNDVEKLCPELSWIVDQFRFIPEWRFDDLMISYAPEGGSVGPHMDLYDVFILQASGRRRWMINTQQVDKNNQVENTPLRIQKDFAIEQEWMLEAGDIIYIPPGVSHYGVADNDCISFSIGFRANSHADMLNDFMAHISQNLAAENTYKDPDLNQQTHPNEITDEAITRVKNIFKQYLSADHPELSNWFGRYCSDSKTDLQLDADTPVDSIEQLLTLTKQQTLARHPASRFTFIAQDETAHLFIDGQQYGTSLNFAQQFCANRNLNIKHLLESAQTNEKQLIIDLYNNGQLYLS